MSVSTFFEKTKAQIKNAVSAHPIEIFLISAFAIGIWFMELEPHQGNDHLAYWVFEPMLFIFVYLSRPYSWYRFSWIVPLVALAIIGMTMIVQSFIYRVQNFGAQILLRYWCIRVSI